MSEITTLDFSRASRLAKSLCLVAALAMPTSVWAVGNARGTEAQSSANAPEVQSKKDQKVTGVVVDAKTGEPIIGASVLIKGTSRGAVTDVNGKFSLSVPDKATVVVSYVGYKAQVVTATDNMSIRLVEDAETLQDVVVVGYGTQKKVNVTGSVAQIDAKALEARPVNNVSQALQGVIPGLNLSTTAAGGELNSSMSFNVRGAGSIGEGSVSSPLVLIDGAEGDLNSLNPNDIANISVLKDAASASIYGARAAFGVILVTTKSGKRGKAQISYGSNFRYATATNLPEMMNSVEFARYFNAASSNSGGEVPFSQTAIQELQKNLDWQRAGSVGEPPVLLQLPDPDHQNQIWGQYSLARGNTDWFKEFYRSNAPSQEHNLSIRGGTETLNYSVSGNILKSEGLLRVAKDKLSRYNLSARLGAGITSWADLEYSVRWTQNSYERPTYLTHQDGIFYHNIARRWPTNPLRDKNGNYIEHSEIQQLQSGLSRDNSKTLVQAINLRLHPLSGWTINGEFTYRNIHNSRHRDKRLVYYYDVNNQPNLMNYSWGPADKGENLVRKEVTENVYWVANLYTDYTRSFGNHNLAVKLGTNIEENRDEDLSVERKNLISEEAIAINTATDNTPWVAGGYGDWALVGYFARLNYSYADKYLFEANVRRDGSSRFVGDKRWGTFPSFSLGWNIAKENFFHSLDSRISTLKLRTSWGQLGNMNTTDLYPFYRTVPISSFNGEWIVNDTKTNTAHAPKLINQDLTWERITSWNIGLDWSAFGSRFFGSFDYYIRNTFDMIGPAYERSSLLGTEVPRMNNTDMRSLGWELELNWRDRIGKDFKYDLKLVLSDSKQEITRYPNASKSLNTYYTGQILGQIWGYETIGIAKTNEEMTSHLSHTKQDALGDKWAAGDIMYRDLNGDGKINSGANTLSDHGDLKVIGNSTPRYRFGLTVSADYKGFDFRLFLQGVAKRDYAISGPYFWGASGGMWQSAGFKNHLDYFSPSNTDAYYPRPLFDGADKNQQTQTRYLQNAAYLRVKNIQLGYTLPEYLTNKININRVRLYLSADNLITFTKLTKIFDPENLGGVYGSGKLYPLTRVISFGATISL